MLFRSLPWAQAFGFERPSSVFFAVLAVLVVLYLAVVEIVKRLFYRFMDVCAGST